MNSTVLQYPIHGLEYTGPPLFMILNTLVCLPLEYTKISFSSSIHVSSLLLIHVMSHELGPGPLRKIGSVGSIEVCYDRWDSAH